MKNKKCNCNCNCNCSAHRQDETRREMARLPARSGATAGIVTATGVGSIALLGSVFSFNSSQKVGYIPLAYEIPEVEFDRILSEYDKIERRLQQVRPDTLEWCCLYVARQAMCWALTNQVEAPYKNIQRFILTGTPVN